MSPTLGVGLLTVFDTDRSAAGALFGSNWSAWLMAAVFVGVLGLATKAVMISVCGVAVLTVPTVHTPLDGS